MTTPSLHSLPSSASPQLLAPLRFPLYGSRLIEASAGTGKTYTIAALYVRLVLGHGDEYAYKTPLTPPEILVVTFTDVATKELRERIRLRLAEAARAFRLPEGQTVADPFLAKLKQHYPAAKWASCAYQLQSAAEWMDEAAISTIHSWCNRMLSQHAFESGSLFTQALEPNQSALLAECVRDYWRTFIVPCSKNVARLILPAHKTPDALQEKVEKLLPHVEKLSVDDTVMQRFTQIWTSIENLKQAPWQAWIEECRTLFSDAVANKHVNGRKIQKRYYEPWLDTLNAWHQDPFLLEPDLKTGWDRLSTSGFNDAWLPGNTPPNHPLLDALSQLKEIIDTTLPAAKIALLCHATDWVAKRFSAEQSRHAQIGYNDLLSRLHDALQSDAGDTLAQTIRQQFPVAMIDEFQDTDPVQYRIFDAVYQVQNNHKETALIIIGDPKQAIYAFRGADIYTYLQARQACGDRLYSLEKNFRSTKEMVAASNHCFSYAEQHVSGKGAFLFREDTNNPVPFISVSANGRKEHFVCEGVAHAALNTWWLESEADSDRLTKTRYLPQIADVFASEIVRLLNAAKDNLAGFIDESGVFKPLRPSDIAILVNNKNEANIIRRALSARRVHSVYLSERNSIFESEEATEIHYWLAASAAPKNNRLLRTALATPSLGMSFDTFDNALHDEAIWDQYATKFNEYHACWQKQGVLPMLRRLLNDFDVPARLLNAAYSTTQTQSGERTLTNLLHLAEILQEASRTLQGEQALIRYLSEQRTEAKRGNQKDEAQIRLESDANLVQVITIHKSKGLEYPLVFLPFASAFRDVNKKDFPLTFHDENKDLQIELTPDEEGVERSDMERLGEDLRKLYVALTRARYVTWIGLAPVEKMEKSAFGYLLSGGDPINLKALPEYIENFAANCDVISAQAAPLPAETTYALAETQPHAWQARSASRTIREHWWMASYSSLKHAEHTPASDTATQANFQEDREEVQAQPHALRAMSSQVQHHFPRGAEVGNFLHDILEWAAKEGFNKVANAPEYLFATIENRCQKWGWEAWSSRLSGWIKKMLTTPFTISHRTDSAVQTVSLSDLQTVLPEMEFWLSASHVNIHQIDALVRQHTLSQSPRPALENGEINGMLKGFIDLVFEHQGRYYVADYKSNWLGENDEAYTADALKEAILHARYELQYVLYLFALHRLLKSRLPNYDYDTHIGGAVYLFLRGIESTTQGVHIERPPRALIETLDTLFTALPEKEQP